MTEEKSPSAKVELGFDQTRLERLIAGIGEKPESGKIVLRAKANWVAGLRSQSQLRDFIVPTDEPRPFGGSSTAPTPVEMVLGAYGCCLTTGYVMNAALLGVKLEGVEVELEGDLDLRGIFALSKEACPGCTEVRAKVHVRAVDASPEQLQELHTRVVTTSAVGSMISDPVKVQIHLA